MNEQTLIVVDPEVCAGKPVVRGTRVPVEYIIRMARRGYSVQTIAEEFDLSGELVERVLRSVSEAKVLEFA